MINVQAGSFNLKESRFSCSRWGLSKLIGLYFKYIDLCVENETAITYEMYTHFAFDMQLITYLRFIWRNFLFLITLYFSSTHVALRRYIPLLSDSAQLLESFTDILVVNFQYTSRTSSEYSRRARAAA